MQRNQIVLASDSKKSFFVAWKCVNQVSSYDTYYQKGMSPKENTASIHLRSNGNGFVETMCRRQQPLFDSSSHLSFPTTASNNVTSYGRNSDLPFYSSLHAVYKALSFDQTSHIQFPFLVNNRNYTTVLHGIENKKECLSFLEERDSIHFTRNVSFPPLKSLSTYRAKGRIVLCQNQIYENSMSVNTQRQNDASLMDTSIEMLDRLLQRASVDLSLNHLCVEWELKLRRNLSCTEKIYLILKLEHARSQGNVDGVCKSLVLLTHDDSYKKHLYGSRRKSRKNPEMIDLFPFLPTCIRGDVEGRWQREGKSFFLDGTEEEAQSIVDDLYPKTFSNWSEEDIKKLQKCLSDKIK